MYKDSARIFNIVKATNGGKRLLFRHLGEMSLSIVTLDPVGHEVKETRKTLISEREGGGKLSGDQRFWVYQKSEPNESWHVPLSGGKEERIASVSWM